MTQTTQTASAVLEELYFKDGVINDMIAREMPTLLMMEHKTDGGGEGWRLPVEHVNPLGVGASYAGAAANATPSKYVKFVGDFQELYGRIRVSGSLIRRNKGNKTFVIDHVKRQVDGAIYEVKKALSVHQFGNGGGAKGRESGLWTSGNTIVLQEGQAYHFEPGEIIQSSATDGNSGSVKAGSATIVSVDPDNDTIVVDNIAGITGTFAQDDYLFTNTFFGEGMSGVQGWIPLTPSASFRGVNQTLNPNRLAGSRVAAESTIYATLIKLLSRINMNRVNAKVDFCALHPDDMAALRIELEGRKQINDASASGKGNFAHIDVEGVKIRGVLCYEDVACPVGTAFMFSSSSWTYRTCGEMVQLVDEDGQKLDRVSDDDAFEARLWTCGDFLCHNPGANGRAGL